VRRGAAGPLAVLVAVWVATACLDITSNVPAIVSITPVILPSPSVVTGDVSRDTSGSVAPLRVVAFGSGGDTLTDVIVKFFAADSTGKLRVDSLTGLAHGDSLSPAAGVVAQVRQANGVGGFVQTNVVPLPVVPKPDSATKAADTTFTFSGTVTDTLSTSLLSSPLTVTVHAGGDTVVQKYVVEYRIVQEPATRTGATGPTVVLRGNGADSNVAVTNAAGQASLQLRVRLSAVDQQLGAGLTTDTVRIQVRVQFQGQSLPVRPSDVFIIPITGSVK
jgi:hypothetical protein